MEEEKLTLTVVEAAHLLGISRGLAYEMVRLGKLPAVRLNRRWLIKRRALYRLLEGSENMEGKSNGKA